MSKNFSMKLIPVSLAAVFSSGAMAVSLDSPAVAGTTLVYLESAPGLVTPFPPLPANVAAALSGAGNVELGKFGLLQGSLTGTLAGNAVTLSSLSQLDWTANGNALATAYIAGAATSIGAVLTPLQMAQALAVFLNADINPDPLATLFAWQLLSDPNVSDVNLVNGNVVVGLDGLLDAEPFLDGIFLPLGADAPDGSQASEVVKVSYMGKTEYLFGFDAVPTGYAAQDGVSYTGRFVVPEPSAMWLLGIGLIGLLASRRR
jgi:hypothetical protein